jgi:hypothetical protein
MPFATWWRGDPLPVLPPLPPFSAHITNDTQLIARLNNLSQRSIHIRLQSGNRPYIAYLDNSPVAYGWLATQEGGINELQFSFKIPARNCYLWDFLTLPVWRGRGIYPHCGPDPF